MTHPVTGAADNASSHEPGVQGLLAGTLTLLTLYARSPAFDVADAIARHLATLARHPEISGALQATCTELFIDWLGPVELQDCGHEHHWRTVHDTPAMPQ